MELNTNKETNYAYRVMYYLEGLSLCNIVIRVKQCPVFCEHPVIVLFQKLGAQHFVSCKQFLRMDGWTSGWCRYIRVGVRMYDR